MKRNRQVKVVFAATLALAIPAHAETLDGELRTLLTNHPQIQSKAKTEKGAEEGIRAARAGYLPSVKVGGDAGPEYINSPDRRLNQNEAYYRGRDSATVTVTQKIFDGYATDSAVESAKISKSLSGAELRATRQTTLLEGVTVYLDVLRQTKLIALSRENERRVQEQLNLEDERVQKGSGVASDVLTAKQRLQVAKERRVAFEGAFLQAVSKYTQVYGHAPDVAALADPPLPLDLLPGSVEDALTTAEKDNPSIETAARTAELTSERRRTAEAGYYPTLDLVGKADYEDNKNAVTGVRRDWSVLLTANWELFSGFKTQAQVAQASWDHAASRDNQLYAGRKVGEQVRLSWHKLKTAQQRLDLLDNAATLAEEVWQAQKKKQAAGKATVQDVLDEETRIGDAQINYTNAFYDMYQASYDLLAAMGRLEVDNIERGKPATKQSFLRNDPPAAPAGERQQPAKAGPVAAVPVGPVAVAAVQPAPILIPAAAPKAPVAATAPARLVTIPPVPELPAVALADGDGLPDGSPQRVAPAARR